MYNKLTNIEKEIIIGLLLSDGSLKKLSNNKQSSLTVSTIHREFAYKLRTVLPNLSLSIYNKPQNSVIRDKILWNNKESYIIESNNHPYLTELRHEWYTKENQYTKQVPDNIQLTPTILYYFYLGDGYSSYSEDKNSMRLFLCTDSFNLNSLRILQDRLKSLDLNFNISGRNKYKQQYRLGICKRTEIEKFYSVLPECTYNCFKYKWKSYKL